ncbi:MAG: amidohydrolase [Acidimicrobiales bacterium]|nr:amidohydrolase [Acidimicrobiales bacterium]
MNEQDERYIVISADTHAGGSHAQYREYLDPKFVGDFDAWRDRYKNPYKDLKDTDLRVRNWDTERRNADQEADGVVAEVIFPNTVPPFFPSFVLFAQPPTPDEYEHRRAGIQAHNRWMLDFQNEQPHRRAGIGQIFLNDVDDAIEDVRWCAENGLKGGILVGAVPPTCDWIKPLYHPAYDPLWAVCQELGVVVNAHSGTGGPVYQQAPAMPLVHFLEIPFYSQRPFAHLILGGVFERFPGLRFVMTETGAAWLPPMLAQLDGLMDGMRANKVGEMRFEGEVVPPKSATEYFLQNCYVGASQPTPADVRAGIDVLGVERFMWGSDYPHEEGTHPYTLEHLRQNFSHLPKDTVQRMLAGTAAELYGFDLEALRPLAQQVGPRVADVATPLDELPANPNQALLRTQAQLVGAS